MRNEQIHPDVKVAPELFLQSFRDRYSLPETKTRLSEWLEVALTTDNMPYDDSKSREELYNFYHMLVTVSEAIWAMEKK